MDTGILIIVGAVLLIAAVTAAMTYIDEKGKKPSH